MFTRICTGSSTVPVWAKEFDGISRTKAYPSRLRLFITIKKITLRSALLLPFDAALSASPFRFILFGFWSVLGSFLATATARRILTALVAVALTTAGFTRYAFRSAREAMALSASPDSKHYHMYLYQNLINMTRTWQCYEHHMTWQCISSIYLHHGYRQ